MVTRQPRAKGQHAHCAGQLNRSGNIKVNLLTFDGEVLTDSLEEQISFQILVIYWR